METIRTEDHVSPGGCELSLTRILDAPPHLVFEVWTTPEHLTRWWGPKGFTLPSCAIELTVGGAFRYAMRAPDGVVHLLRGTFREIVRPSRLVFTFAWEEPEGDIGPETLVTVTFDPYDGKTKMTLRQTGFASESAARGHEEGWAEAFERLVAYAAKIGGAA